MNIRNVKVDPEKLKTARGDRTLNEVAEQVGVTPQQIQNCEKGRSDPSANLLLRLSLVYGVSVLDLASESDEKNLNAA